jgi:DNA-binding NarL/FixJ family response regulator
MHGKILIADDESLLLESLAKAARKNGYDVEVASNGREALEMAQKRRFDLIVTDIRMPEMDGPTLMGHIALMTPPPQFIAITGYASLESAVDCLRRGAADFLVKPFEVEDFLDSVRRVFARQTVSHVDPDWEEVARRFDLTSRQIEVLRAFYKSGKSNRELADDLFLSPHTVKSHLKAAFDKIGVVSRAQLLRVLREL